MHQLSWSYDNHRLIYEVWSTPSHLTSPQKNASFKNLQLFQGVTCASLYSTVTVAVCVCRMITRVGAFESWWSKLTFEYPSYGLATPRKFSAAVWSCKRWKFGVSKIAINHTFQPFRKYILGRKEDFFNSNQRTGKNEPQWRLVSVNYDSYRVSYIPWTHFGHPWVL